MTHPLRRKLLLTGLVVFTLDGCATNPLIRKSRGQHLLEDGVRDYEDGNLRGAAQTLAAALDEGLPAKDQVTAHKYLAFIACVSGRKVQCREEFKRALDLDPAFDLTPAEAGHPIWGPVFRNLKRPPR